MSEEKEVKFVRLKDSAGGIDIVGVVTYHTDYVLIEKPMKIEVETDYEEGRQIILMQEFLPQSIIEIKEVEFLNSEIMFITPVKNEFVSQYNEVSDFFYNKESIVKQKKVKEPTSTDNVVSLIEAIIEKKNKPVH